MANNIKIIGDITDIITVSRYTEEDINLLTSKKLTEFFGEKEDYIEYYIYDVGGNLLDVNYNYLNYKLPPSSGLASNSSTPNTTGNIQTENIGIISTLSNSGSLYPIIEIDPIKDIQNTGYTSGEFKVRYNFFKNRISNVIDAALFIKEISPDRTELRLASLTLSNEEIENLAISLIDEINNTTDYYVDYLLNFGENTQVIAVNIALNRVPEGYEILFKLYQPLPLDINNKTQLWVVEEKVSPYEFEINLDKLIIPPPPPTLRGPNFDIELNNVGTVGTPYTNYQTLVSRLETLQNSSYQQILGLLTSQSADINVNYTDYNNFIFFGSAEQRLTNFYIKIKQIEDYNILINTYTPLTSSTPNLITEINFYSSSINNIISQLDGYESYLYFESSSYSWPKSGSLKPFTLLSTGSSVANNWYLTSSLQSSIYDEDNVNNLKYAIPAYLVDDVNNQPFITFLNMVGHYFDNIWVYLKAITDLNVANNNLEAGISKDLVYYQLQSLGLKLYNSQAGEDINQFLIGANTGSSVWDNNTTITGSYLNNVPRKDLLSELYKRIYHNLPLLLKQKGTVEGLDNLMTVFGLPNRDYYTIYSGSNDFTYYTPTGSVLTSSILNVKEFGGSLKSDLIKGYNNDKVRIVDNSLVENYYYSGSILSPFHSLQTYPTSSNEFRENDMHYVDISFSPQTQIDTYISGAISSSNPTWSLDDYIGDPRQLYNSSYTDLDNQRKLYYQTGVPGFAPFTASLLDYNKFIRLIQYFDNSLFKMLADFIPERASLSTGVTFNSPILERNKAVYANPTTSTTESVYTAEYSASTISSQYGNFYNALSSSNNTEAWYNGELSGSLVDIGEQFENANYNPYLYPNDPTIVFNTNCETYRFTNTPGGAETLIFFYYTKCFETTPTLQVLDVGDIDLCINTRYPSYIDPSNPLVAGGSTLSSSSLGACGSYLSINQNQFNHSEFNILLNNISSSVESQVRNDIEYVYGTTRSIIYPAELQDSYLSLRSYNTSRYEGSKLTSLLYNNYTSTPYTGSDGMTIQFGDNSYGKTAVINHYVRKIGIFTQVETSSFFPDKNTVALKYLVDEKGNLTELNQRNKHWEDIQRTFISSNTASISLFDNRKFGNQKRTDGRKILFDTGYSYTPVLYMGSCYITPTLAFDNSNNPGSFLTTARNSLVPNQYISGSSSPRYPFVLTGAGSFVTNLFDLILTGEQYFTSSSATNSGTTTYNVVDTAPYNIDISIPITYRAEVSPPQSSSWQLDVIITRNGNPTTYSQEYLYVTGDPQEVFISYTYSQGKFNYLVTGGPVWSTPIVILASQVTGYTDASCLVGSGQSTVHTTTTIPAGSRGIEVVSNTPLTATSTRYQRGGFINFGTYGKKFNNQFFTLPSGCIVYVSIPSTCETYTP